MDLAHLARITEEGFALRRPVRLRAGRRGRRRGQLPAHPDHRWARSAGEVIAPTAEETDQVGNTLNPDGSVTYAPGIAKALKRLGQADLMGFTLPYRFGGLNCPNLVYTMANEIVSRGRRLADEHLRPPGHRRDDQRLRLRGDQAGVPAPHGQRRVDRRDGADRAGRRQRPPGRQDPRLPGRRRATGSSAASSGSSPTAAARCCWCWPAPSRRSPTAAGLSPAPGRARARGEGPPAGEQAGHPRQPDVRDLLRRRPGQAHRRAPARADHLRHEPDERRPHRHRRPEPGHRRGRLPRRPRLRPQPQAVRARPSRTSRPCANCWWT